MTFIWCELHTFPSDTGTFGCLVDTVTFGLVFVYAVVVVVAAAAVIFVFWGFFVVFFAAAAVLVVLLFKCLDVRLLCLSVQNFSKIEYV